LIEKGLGELLIRAGIIGAGFIKAERYMLRSGSVLDHAIAIEPQQE
jgi:hypothetical protein